MDRLACVDVPALPLQLLRLRHPEWARHPVVVVDRDSPQGTILWSSPEARRVGILPGLRYAAGLALTAHLRGDEVSGTLIEKCLENLTAACQSFTPHVEPSRQEPGLFWLDASGLDSLYPSLDSWAAEISGALERLGFEATIVVGFSRFGSYAVAKASSGCRVLTSPAEEMQIARCVRLEQIGLEPAVRETLSRLAVHTVGGFLQLPPAGILRRFGRQPYELFEWATGKASPPLSPEPALEPISRHIHLDDPELDAACLLFLSKQLMDSLLGRLPMRGEAVQELVLSLRMGKAGDRIEKIRPAAPTLESSELLALVRLRLESLQLPQGVTSLMVTLHGTPATSEQLTLFTSKPRRDLRAAEKALARVRAAFGDQATVYAKLLEGHLPEAHFDWEKLDRLGPASPQLLSSRSLVRRMQSKPTVLPPRARHEPDGWLIQGRRKIGSVARLHGPYLLSGGWWRREIERDYYFAELRSGDLLWIYYDRRRRRWLMQGEIS